MTFIEKKIKAAEKKVEKLHQKRSAAFNGPEKEYNRINFRLNCARKDLQALYSVRANSNKQDCPVVERNHGYTRYETLPNEIQDKIGREWLFNGYIYYVKGGPVALNLKDAVAYLTEYSYLTQ